MRVQAMEIRDYVGELFPLLPVDRVRDAVQGYCAYRWPTGRRKAVAIEFDLSADEARSVCDGTASQATLDKLWRHPNGGWSLIFPVFGALIGETAEDYLTKQRKRHAELARRSGSLVRDLRAGDPFRHRPHSEPDPDRARRRDAGGR